MLEIFKPIENYLDYLISNKGRVYSKKSNKFLKLLANNGYLMIQPGRKSKKLYIHRLVAKAFIPNPDNLPQVNHKDEDKTNNCVDNLEWCDAKYNNNYGTRIQRCKENQNSKPILQYTKNMEFVKEWNSISEARKFYESTNITTCLSGKRKSACGFYWKYK